MKFIHSHYKNDKVSVALSQIVAVVEGSREETLIYCTDNEVYTSTESYDLIMRKIEDESRSKE